MDAAETASMIRSGMRELGGVMLNAPACQSLAGNRMVELKPCYKITELKVVTTCLLTGEDKENEGVASNKRISLARNE